MNDWLKKALFRGFADMHIPNGEGYLEKYDPETYAENFALAGSKAVYIYASNCLGLAFYPSKVGRLHEAAKRDIFGETVKACKKRGLHVVGYLNSWNTYYVDDHPEASVMDKNGCTLRDNSRYGNPCINNDAYADFFMERVRELVSSYELDGLWVDMVGYWMPACFCGACKQKYFEKTGRQIPEKVDMNSPDFMDYIKFKEQSLLKYVTRIRETAKKINPEITVAIQAAGSKNPYTPGFTHHGFYAASDYLSGDFYTDREGVNAISRLFYKLTEHLPFEFMTSRCCTLDYHTMNRDVGELTAQAFSALMYKGAFFFIDAVDPSGTYNRAFYENMRRVHDTIAPYLEYADFEEKPLRDVAIFYNLRSTASSIQNGEAIEDFHSRFLMERMRRIGRSLNAAGIDYDILSKKNLSELENYRLIILSDLEMLSEEETAALRKYVKNGGSIYASRMSSLKNENAESAGNFALSDVFGVDYAGEFDISPGYLAPVQENKALFGDYSAEYPHMLNEKFVKVLSKGASVLASVTLPVSDAGDKNVFSSTISNPPILHTDFPAVTENVFGNGKCIYAAGALENSDIKDNARLFTALIGRLLPENLRVKVKAPPCVDFTVYKSKDNYKVYLLNYQTIFPPIPINEVLIELQIGDEQIHQVRDLSGNPTEWRVENGVLYLKTPLTDFKMLQICFS